MSQIFISHSANDRDWVNFLSNALATTKVKMVVEEFEKIAAQQVNAEQIKKNIIESNAVFVVLTENVNHLQHTRDWVVWESGVASSAKKDVWIFEPLAQVGRVSVVVPHFTHYVLIEQTDSYLAYLRKIVESYDNSDALGAAIAGAGLGAAGGLPGAALGAIGGLILSDKSASRPQGVQISCPKCVSTYRIHIPQGLKSFRCAVCNQNLQLTLEKPN